MTDEPTRVTAWDILGAWPDHLGVPDYDETDLAAATRRGFDAAIAALRDRDRYERWMAADMATGAWSFWPDFHHAPRFADYLQAVANAQIEGTPTP